MRILLIWMICCTQATTARGGPFPDQAGPYPAGRGIPLNRDVLGLEDGKPAGIVPTTIPGPQGTVFLDPQRLLDRAVARNNGSGGGVFRVGTSPDLVLWEGASGEVVRQGEPMPVDANFEIASTSKTFTAAAVLLLVEQGILDLDAPISDYLPPAYTNGLLVIDGHDYGPELTLRQCLSHISGLPDYWNDPPYILPGINAFLFDYIIHPDRLWTPEEILAYVPDLDPIFVPGTGWHYSDTGFLLAGLILEQVTGDSLQAIYHDLIDTPLGLRDTWLHWRESPTGGLAESHRYEGTWDMYTRRHNSADWGGGGLVSSTRDLERFIRALADDELFADPGTRHEMMSWIPTGTDDIEYGLGLFRVRISENLGWIWGHDGYGNSFMYYWPDQDVTFVGTLNQTENDWWPLVVISAYLIDSYRGRPSPSKSGTFPGSFRAMLIKTINGR